MNVPPPIADIADVRALSALPYAQFMPQRHVLDALAATAARHGGRPALTALDEPDLDAPPRRWTHGELLSDIHRTANLFHALAGDAPPRVALLMPPMAETHIALWAAEAAGTACPINFQLNAEHIAALLRACQADILVALGPAPDLDIDARLPGLAAACPALRHVLRVPAGPGLPLPPGARGLLQEASAYRGDGLDFALPGAAIAALFHTGGTTGVPKLAQHTHANQLHAAWGAACMFGARADDVILNGFPLFHVAGAFVYGLSMLMCGAELVLPTRLGLRNRAFMDRFDRFVEQHGVTLIAGVPTVMAGLLALDLQPARLRSVRAMLTGGSPLPDGLARAFEQRFRIPVRNILGMTETAGVISIEPLAGPRTPGSCGLPLPFTQVAAWRSDGTRAGAGEAGILRVRGPNVSPGYTDVHSNAGSFDGDWLLSGDIGHLDAEGRVFVTGRAKDLIIRGAHNIDPGLIESALLQHPAVLMAAAVGEPDAYAGELPVAYVSLKPGAQATAEDIAAFAAPLIAERPAVPRRVEILPAIPTTAVGKVYKPALRARATQHVLQALLAAQGLDDRATLAVDEGGAAGLAVRFEVADEAAQAAVQRLMQPFALAFSVAVVAR
jgi:fatty-acyl-CoA synthase